MTYYGFVFAKSKNAIESVAAREDGVYSVATYEIYDESSSKELHISRNFFSRILFIAKSMKRQEVEESVEAVCNVYNTWCLNQKVQTPDRVRFQKYNNWTNTAHSCTIQEKGFVYLYRLWQNQDSFKDEAFYVGMSIVGDKSRETDHIDETLKARNKHKPFNNSKQNKIFEWLDSKNLIYKRGEEYFHCYDPEQHNLVNRIAEGLTKIAALAVESFLISHYYGAFKLTNATNGNSALREIRAYFVSRPRVISSANDFIWERVVHEFLKAEGTLKQKARFDLQFIAIVDGSSFASDLSRQIRGRLTPDGLPRNIATDVEWSWKFIPGSGPSWVRFQLRFSSTHASVVINLRRSNKSTCQEFKFGISKIWKNPDFKNDNSNAVYFKPYGILRKTNTKDTLFSYVDLTEMSTVARGYPELLSEFPEDEQLELRLTLPQAITRLINQF